MPKTGELKTKTGTSQVDGHESRDSDCEEQLQATQECLRRFVDDEPCHMNAVGQCTTVQHGGIPGPCRVADAREVLGMDPNIDDPYTADEKKAARQSRREEIKDRKDELTQSSRDSRVD